MKPPVFLCLVGLVILPIAFADGAAPVISTEEGKVSGIVEKAANGNAFFSYYGIPFAEPPLGELRFKDPVKATNWKGVRDGSSMPSPCIQVPFDAALMGMKKTADELPGKEDCLYLNVFKPKADPPKGGFPVMVYIHGGGFFAGSAEEYLPHVLLSRDIVLVVIQYRLGYLGFLSTEDDVIPGNYGLKDQTLALQWVQRNIGHFGGDSKRVTIFGESAGGASVHYQMLSPKSKGLFNGVIMHSGNAFCGWAFNSRHRKTAEEIGSFVGCDLKKGSLSFLKCMQAADPRKINAVNQDLFEWSLLPLSAVPRVDGDFLPDHPARLMREGRYNKVNLISGITADEGAILTQGMYRMQHYLLDNLEKDFPINGPYSVGMYPEEDPTAAFSRAAYGYYLGGGQLDQRTDEYTKMMSDYHFGIAHDFVSELHAHNKDTSMYRYELNHRGQISFGDYCPGEIGQHWIPHADDLYYLFRGGPLLTPKHQPPQRPKDLENPDDLHLRELMLDMWTNFAAGGNPTPDDSLGFRWDATTAADLRHLALSPAPSMKGDARKDARRFYLSLPTETNLILNPGVLEQQKCTSESKWRGSGEL